MADQTQFWAWGHVRTDALRDPWHIFKYLEQNLANQTAPKKSLTNLAALAANLFISTLKTKRCREVEIVNVTTSIQPFDQVGC